MNATIALLMRLTDPRGSLGDYWMGVGCAAILAVRHFNDHDGSVVPQFASSPNRSLRLNEIVFDTASTEAGGIRAYRTALEKGMHGFVGAARSAVSQPVAQLGSIDRIPQLSYWSSSPDLSNKQVYGYFGRTFPNDALSGGFLMATITAFGWRRVGAIHVQDIYASALIKVMQQYSVLFPGAAEMPVATSFTYGVAADVRTGVKTLRASGMNIFVFVAFDNDVEALFEAAEAEGMLNNEYVWLTADTTTSDSPLGTADPMATARRLQGSLAVRASVTTAQGYGRLADTWASLTPSDCSNDVFQPPARIFSAPLPEVGAYAYDCVAALGLGLATVAEVAASKDSAVDDDISDGDTVFAAIKALSFDGATGRVEFNHDTGDRAGENLAYTVYNFRLSLDGSGLLLPMEQSIVGAVTTRGLDLLAPILWKGGGTDTPIDRTSLSDLQCDSGYIKTELPDGYSICTACARGTYEEGNVICMPADSLSYVPDEGMNRSGIRRCDPSMRVTQMKMERSAQCDTDVAECVSLGVQMQPLQGAAGPEQCKCVQSTYLHGNGSQPVPRTDVSTRCASCPSGGICAGGDIPPVALPGFGQLSLADPTQAPVFFRCSRAASCPGGSVEPLPGGSQGVVVVRHAYLCADGHLNGSSLCHRCAQGYGQKSGTCEKCEMGSASIVVLSLLFVLTWFPVLRDMSTKRVKSL